MSEYIVNESKAKIVYALYRVSTQKQVDKQKNDIPMQKEACREFANKMGWQIGKEFLEKGISGFKISAENRDAIQDLKAAALKFVIVGNPVLRPLRRQAHRKHLS